MAEFVFYTAPMNSGKTLELMRAVTAEKRSERRDAIVLKSKRDTKGDSVIVTRFAEDYLNPVQNTTISTEEKTRIQMPVDYIFGDQENLFTAINAIHTLRKLSSVYVDEAQFVTREQAKQLGKVSTILGINVFCYGLKASSNLDLFEGSSALIALASHIEMSQIGYCSRCEKQARHNIRRVFGEVTFDAPEIAIEGADENTEYETVCNNCLNSLGGLD